jgi:hypothetical protein
MNNFPKTGYNVLAIATVLSLIASGSGDVLYKKRTPVSIGFGNTAKGAIDWMPCDRSKNAKYDKPPFWITKGDNCNLKAENLGLGSSDHGYVVAEAKKTALFFPDVKAGESVAYNNDSASGLITLTFDNRSILLPYGAPPSEQQQISNELSGAVGFVNIGQSEIAGDLVEDANGVIQAASPGSFPADVIVNAGNHLFRIKDRAPALSSLSHSSLLRLAYLRSTLQPVPPIVGQGGQDPGCGISEAQDLMIKTTHFRFGVGNPCGIALAAKPYGQNLRASIEQVLIEGGTHVLDGITWTHDTFFRSRIRYRGGPLSLQSVLFVDCTFEVPDTPRGDRVVNMAILAGRELMIGNESGFRKDPMLLPGRPHTLVIPAR